MSLDRADEAVNGRLAQRREVRKSCLVVTEGKCDVPLRRECAGRPRRTTIDMKGMRGRVKEMKL